MAKNLGDCSCSGTSAGTAEGNPINTGTGNKYQTETDFIGGPATGLSLTRAYNSLDAASSAFGSKWHSTWHRGAIAAAGGSAVTVTRADGRQDVFTKNGAGAYVTDADVTSVLSAQPTGWKLVTADDTVENYTPAGLLSFGPDKSGIGDQPHLRRQQSPDYGHRAFRP